MMTIPSIDFSLCVVGPVDEASRLVSPISEWPSSVSYQNGAVTGWPSSAPSTPLDAAKRSEGGSSTQPNANDVATTDKTLATTLATTLAENEHLQVALESVIANFEPRVEVIEEEAVPAAVEAPVVVETTVAVATAARVGEAPRLAGEVESTAVESETASRAVPLTVDAGVGARRGTSPTTEVAAPVVSVAAVPVAVAHAVDAPALQSGDTVTTVAEPSWTRLSQSRPVEGETPVTDAKETFASTVQPIVSETPVAVDVSVPVAVTSGEPAGRPEVGPYQATAAEGEDPVAVSADVAALVAGVRGGEGASAPGSVAPAEKAPAVTAVDAVRTAYAPEATFAAAAVSPESAVLVEAASAVADALLVTPGLMRGQGEIVVQLKPEVLDGTEVRISVTGRELAVTFVPVTVDAAVLIERCQLQLAAHLSAKIAAFNVSVDVRKKRS